MWAGLVLQPESDLRVSIRKLRTGGEGVGEVPQDEELNGFWAVLPRMDRRAIG